MSSPQEAQAERDLVDRCLADDPTAWRCLDDRHHLCLWKAIRCRLGVHTRDENVAGEIEEDVWYALFFPDRKRLRHFDPDQGSLDDYLGSLARGLIRLWLRRRQRGRETEGLAEEHCAAHNTAVVPLAVMLEEIEAHLPHRQLRRLREWLRLCQVDDNPLEPASARARKRKQRLLRQIVRILHSL